MLHHPTLDQLRHLKLHGMARAFAELGDNAQAGELDHAQWLALLLDREEAERNDRRLTYRLRNARLRHAIHHAAIAFPRQNGRPSGSSPN